MIIVNDVPSLNPPEYRDMNLDFSFNIPVLQWNRSRGRQLRKNWKGKGCNCFFFAALALLILCWKHMLSFVMEGFFYGTLLHLEISGFDPSRQMLLFYLTTCVSTSHYLFSVLLTMCPYTD